MNMETKGHETSNAAAIWIPVGLAIGCMLGIAFGDARLGPSIGLIGGSIVTLSVERRQKKTGLLSLIVAVVALVWIVALRIIERS